MSGFGAPARDFGDKRESDGPLTRGRARAGLVLPLVVGPEGCSAAESSSEQAQRIGDPGRAPFTRGIHATMYGGRPWTIRQYAGFGSAEETNARFRYLLDQGQTGLSVAFDLPTQMGYDSDHPIAVAEVGRVGVAIDSIDDMRRLFRDIPLDAVSTSMTINAPAAALVLLYELVAEEQGIDPAALRGTVQNDILKEYVARGTYIFPPRPSLRLAIDLVAYCGERLPGFHSMSISGYHMAEAGATAVQELAFTFGHAVAYVEAACAAGLAVDAFAPRLSFFLVARTRLLEEVAKFRAARRIWARLMRERFGARDPRSQMLRLHVQTAGVQLAAQQPHNNVVRVTLQALAAVLGGTQSLHANAYDEALGLPSEDAAQLAVRTQQILALETGLTETVDPLGGSYVIEHLTDQIEAQTLDLLAQVDAVGGAVAAIEEGFPQRLIEESAWNEQAALEDGDRVVVGVNRFTTPGDGYPAVFQAAPGVAEEQADRLRVLRVSREEAAVHAALAQLQATAQTADNVIPSMREALRNRATVGEVCEVLRGVWGTYDERR